MTSESDVGKIGIMGAQPAKRPGLPGSYREALPTVGMVEPNDRTEDDACGDTRQPSDRNFRVTISRLKPFWQLMRSQNEAKLNVESGAQERYAAVVIVE